MIRETLRDLLPSVAASLAPLGTVIDCCDAITCECWGGPSDASKEILAGFGATYHETAKDAFALNPAPTANRWSEPPAAVRRPR